MVRSQIHSYSCFTNKHVIGNGDFGDDGDGEDFEFVDTGNNN